MNKTQKRIGFISLVTVVFLFGATIATATLTWSGYTDHDYHYYSDYSYENYTLSNYETEAAGEAYLDIEGSGAQFEAYVKVVTSSTGLESTLTSKGGFGISMGIDFAGISVHEKSAVRCNVMEQQLGSTSTVLCDEHGSQ